MINQIISAAFFFMANILFATCDKNHDRIVPEGSVDFYLIDSFDTTDNSCQIDESSVVIRSAPVIEYEDLISYDPAKYAYKITDQAIEIIKDLPHSVFGLGFAVKANNKLIYTGYFWPAYSSMACQWIVIDPVFVHLDKTMEVELRYPGLMEGITIPDRRNDPRILDIFRRDGKLIE